MPAMSAGQPPTLGLHPTLMGMNMSPQPAATATPMLCKIELPTIGGSDEQVCMLGSVHSL